MYDDFAIDPDELDAVVSDIARTETSLDHLTRDIAQQTAALHDHWEGLTAAAHRDAQHEWAQGLAAMRDALTDLRAAAAQASRNYAVAASANRSMWEGLK